MLKIEYNNLKVKSFCSELCFSNKRVFYHTFINDYQIVSFSLTEYEDNTFEILMYKKENYRKNLPKTYEFENALHINGESLHSILMTLFSCNCMVAPQLGNRKSKPKTITYQNYKVTIISLHLTNDIINWNLHIAGRIK